MSVHQIIKNQFFDNRIDYCNDLIKKQQKEDDNYIIKNLNDKINCSICGGKYVRYAKTKHIKTKKHQEAIKSIHDFVFN